MTFDAKAHLIQLPRRVKGRQEIYSSSWIEAKTPQPIMPPVGQTSHVGCGKSQGQAGPVGWAAALSPGLTGAFP